MADNTTLNEGTGGDVIASDDISGVKYPRSKIVIGANGVNDGDVSAANPLPITDAGLTGALTETAPATDTASSGLNGRLQRIAQRLTSLIDLLPTALGGNGGLKIEGVASGTVVPVADGGGSITVDAPVATPAFVRLSDGASAIATLPVSLASVPSHAVTNAGTFAVQDGPQTSGGLSIFRSIDLDESEEEVKATAGQVYSIHVMNLSTSIRYLKLYNATAANVTVGTTTPVLTIPIPAASSGGAGFVWNIDKGLAFDTAITAAATTGIADNDSGAPGANEVVINLGYK